jgi:hypothetical protein
MSNEELNRKMEFIIEQQAQFSADIEVMREVHAADTKLLKEETKLVKEQTRSLNESVHSLNAAVTAVVGMVGRLSEAQELTEGKLAQLRAHTDARFADLAEAQTHTEERLNILIDVVGRHFSGNGGSRS